MYLAIFFNRSPLGDDPTLTLLSMYMFVLVISSRNASMQLLVSTESATNRAHLKYIYIMFSIKGLSEVTLLIMFYTLQFQNVIIIFECELLPFYGHFCVDGKLNRPSDTHR